MVYTKKSMRKLILCLTIAVFIISGCSPSQPLSTRSAPLGTPIIGAYPYPGSESVSAENPTGETYPYPDSESSQAIYPAQNAYPYPEPSVVLDIESYATAGPVPTPASDKGVITGHLLINGEPVSTVILYLADVTKDDQGIERLAGFSRTSSPTAQVDLEGKFVFADVPPGRYGLVLDTIHSAYLLHQPGEEIEWLFEVIAGELLDLGNLDYDSLPIPDS